jgi:hypothetical protein
MPPALRATQAGKPHDCPTDKAVSMPSAINV